MPVNMHMHSMFSIDGWDTPEEIADRMAATGVTLMALTDHNSVGGVFRCRHRAESLGMRFLTGVEIDAEWHGSSYHFLAFGFDAAHAGLRAFCERQLAQYALNYERIHPLVERRFGLDRSTLKRAAALRYRTHPAPVLNKWLARSWVEAHGGFSHVEAARAAMSALVAEAERDVMHPWHWASFAEARDVVRAAGGILLLAHVSYYHDDARAQLSLIESLLAEGLDGFELYHPVNTASPHFDVLVDAAHRWRCPVSGGADTHGAREPRTKPAPVDFTGPDWMIDTLDKALAVAADRAKKARETS